MGSGVGKGEDEDVKGTWRVNVFLFLLTGSQGVLLPWTPLILKAAGFSAQGVGVATCIITLASSLGVVACLTCVRRTRSGAVRRLLLLLLLASAAALHVSAVILLQQQAAGRLVSCYHQNSSNSAPPFSSLAFSTTSQPLSSPSALGSPSTPPLLSSSTSVTKLPSSSMVHQNGSIVLTKTQNVTTLLPPSNMTFEIQSVITSSTTTAITTLTNYNRVTTKEPEIPNLHLSGTVDIRPDETHSGTKTKPEKHTKGLPVTSPDEGLQEKQTTDRFTTSWPTNIISSSNNDAESEFSHKAQITPKQPHEFGKSVNHIKTTARGLPDTENSDQQADVSDVTDIDSPQKEVSKDNSLEDDDGDYNYDDYSDNQQGDENSLIRFSGPGRNTNILSKPSLLGKYSANNFPVLSDREKSSKTIINRLGSAHWSPKTWLNKVAAPQQTHVAQTNHITKSVQGFPVKTDKHVWLKETPSSSSGQGIHTSESYILSQVPPPPQVPSPPQVPLPPQVPPPPQVPSPPQVPLPPQVPPPPQVPSPPITSSSDGAKRTLPAADSRWEDSRHQFHPERDLRRSYSSELLSWLSPPGSQTDESGSQHPKSQGLRSGVNPYKIHQRNRRSLPLYTGNENYDNNDINTEASPVNQNDASIKSHKNLPQDKVSEESQIMSGSQASGIGVKMGVAVLVIMGGFVGAGVEASVAQLWHCYSHGYDEGGVSHDILQRTITHTFHLSTYASHKSWSLLTSGAWLLVGGALSVIACMVGVEVGVYGGLASVHLALVLCALVVLLLVPAPYGSVDPPRTRRPLSLYLDDEVLREGLRRLTFHSWVLANGCLAAFSFTYSIWLLQEMTSQGSAMGAQTAALAVALISEGLTHQTQRWLMSHWGLQGTMGIGGVGVMIHFGVMWASDNVGLVVVSHAGLGCGLALMWVAVKNNSLLLATVSDQEHEAWASWWCWRLGVGVGAAMWGSGVQGTGETVRPLLLHATLISAAVASTVGVAAIITRRNWRTHRRVYHTLDLNMADSTEDDHDDDDPCEDDWLVKRAKKEGITL